MTVADREAKTTINAEGRLQKFITDRILNRFPNINIDFSYNRTSEPFMDELVRNVNGVYVVDVGQIISEYNYIGSQTYPLNTIIRDIIDSIRNGVK